MPVLYTFLCLSIYLITTGVSQHAPNVQGYQIPEKVGSDSGRGNRTETGSPSLIRYHVSEEGRNVTLRCPPHDNYNRRGWTWGKNPLSPNVTDIYVQNSGDKEEMAQNGSRSMSLNEEDWSLTIGDLRVEDTGQIYCWVEMGKQTQIAYTHLAVYNRWVDVPYNTKVKVQCPSDAVDYAHREWYTRTWSAENLIFNHTMNAIIKRGVRAGGKNLTPKLKNLIIDDVRQDDYLLTCCTITPPNGSVGVIFNAIHKVPEMEAAEKKSVTLPCNEVGKRTSQDKYFTRTWQRVNGDVLYHQYLFNGVFFEYRPAARVDMSINNATFALTIARAELEDNTIFICTFSNRTTSYVESVKLIIHNQSIPTPSPTPSSVPTVPNLPPVVVMGGAAAGSTVVIMGAVVCICVRCRRKKAKDDKAPDEIRSGFDDPDVYGGYYLGPPVPEQRPVQGEVNGFLGHNLNTGSYLRPSPVQSPQDEGYIEPINWDVVRPSDGSRAHNLNTGSYLHPPQDSDYVIPVNHRKRGRGQYRAALPDVTRPGSPSLPARDYHEYEEIAEEEQVPSALPPQTHQYELLRVQADTPIVKFFKHKDIPEATPKKLKRHDIVTVQHLLSLSQEDMDEIGLTVGEKKRIANSLEDLSATWF